MEKCILCGKTEEGILCKHCIAKGASNVGGFVNGAGKYVGMVVLTIIGAVITDKIKDKS